MKTSATWRRRHLSLSCILILCKILEIVNCMYKVLVKSVLFLLLQTALHCNSCCFYGAGSSRDHIQINFLFALDMSREFSRVSGRILRGLWLFWAEFLIIVIMWILQIVQFTIYDPVLPLSIRPTSLLKFSPDAISKSSQVTEPFINCCCHFDLVWKLCTFKVDSKISWDCRELCYGLFVNFPNTQIVM